MKRRKNEVNGTTTDVTYDSVGPWSFTEARSRAGEAVSTEKLNEKCCESREVGLKCTPRGSRRKYCSTMAVAVRHHPIDYRQLISMPATRKMSGVGVKCDATRNLHFFSLGRETFEEMFMLDRRNVMRHRHMQGEHLFSFIKFTTNAKKY